MMDDVVARLSKVSKTYGSSDRTVRALIDIDLSLRVGESLALVGPSGCGKSSLLRLISLLAQPTTGEVYVDGRLAPSNQNARARLRNEFVGIVQQDLAVIEEESVESNVAIPLNYAQGRRRLMRHDKRARVRSLLERVGLEGAIQRRVGDLSGGEKQRVAIARAMANAPRLIVADEPTSSLDSANVAAVMKLLTSLTHEGGSLIVATHDARVSALCDSVVYLEDGRVVKQNSGKVV